MSSSPPKRKFQERTIDDFMKNADFPKLVEAVRLECDHRALFGAPPKKLSVFELQQCIKRVDNLVFNHVCTIDEGGEIMDKLCDLVFEHIVRSALTDEALAGVEALSGEHVFIVHTRDSTKFRALDCQVGRDSFRAKLHLAIVLAWWRYVKNGKDTEKAKYTSICLMFEAIAVAANLRVKSSAPVTESAIRKAMHADQLAPETTKMAATNAASLAVSYTTRLDDCWIVRNSAQLADTDHVSGTLHSTLDFV